MLMFTGDLDAGEKRLDLYLRYQTTNERSYYKARTELQNLRKQKRVEEIGFDSQKRKEAEEAPPPGHSRIAYSDIHDAAALRTIIKEQNGKAAAWAQSFLT